MKKIIVLVCGILFSVTTFSVSAAALIEPPGEPNYNLSSCFPSTWGGIIYSNSTRTMYIGPKQRLNDSSFIVLGKVESSSSMENVLYISCWGDTSYNTLKKRALKKYHDADDIINIEIDAKCYNICVFYFRTTAILRGIAIKYKK